MVKLLDKIVLLGFLIFELTILQSCIQVSNKSFYLDHTYSVVRLNDSGNYNLIDEFGAPQIGQWRKKRNYVYLTSLYDKDSIYIESIKCIGTGVKPRTLYVKNQEGNSPIFCLVYYYNSRFKYIDSSYVHSGSNIITCPIAHDARFARIIIPHHARLRAISSMFTVENLCDTINVTYGFPNNSDTYFFRKNEPYKIKRDFLFNKDMMESKQFRKILKRHNY